MFTSTNMYDICKFTEKCQVMLLILATDQTVMDNNFNLTSFIHCYCKKAIFFKICFENISSFIVGSLIFKFWIVVTSTLSFQLRMNPLPCVLCHLNMMDSSDSLLVQLLLAWQPNPLSIFSTSGRAQTWHCKKQLRRYATISCRKTF